MRRQKHGFGKCGFLLCALWLLVCSVAWGQDGSSGAVSSPTIGTALSQLKSEGEWLQAYSARLDAMLLASENLVSASSSWQTESKKLYERLTQEFSTRLSEEARKRTWLAVAAGAGWTAAAAAIIYAVLWPK